MKALMAFAAVMACMVSVATAQSLTPEQLQAMIDQELSRENPYKAILADPDPERSLAAMRIMLRSGDQELVAMALEFGLLSPNPQVQRVAVEAYMTTNPVLTVRLDGTDVKNTRLASFVRENLKGTLDHDRIGFARLDLGALSEDGTCYKGRANSNCLLTINRDGIFLTARFGTINVLLNARLVVNDAGQLEGIASLRGIDELVPISIQLLD